MIETLEVLNFNGNIFKPDDIVVINTEEKTFTGRIVLFGRSAFKPGRCIKLDMSSLYNEKITYIHFDDVKDIYLLGEQV